MVSWQQTTTKTFTVRWVQVDAFTYTEKFKEIRDNLRYKARSCFKCHKRHEIGDSIGLVALEGMPNRIVCTACAHELANKIFNEQELKTKIDLGENPESRETSGRIK